MSGDLFRKENSMERLRFDPEGVVTTLGNRTGEEPTSDISLHLLVQQDWMKDLGIQDNPVHHEIGARLSVLMCSPHFPGWLLGWSFFYIVLAWLVLVLQAVGSLEPF